MKAVLNTAAPREHLLCPVNGQEAIRDRRAMLDAPHLHALTAWVRTVRDRLDPCHAQTVADFDPRGGGTAARVMYLAQDPSSTATETGFISPDNNDATAKATTEACAAAGLEPNERIHWNVYPWWRAAPCPTPVPRADALAHTMLDEVLRLLPELKAVVLIGTQAADAWQRVTVQTTLPSDTRVWSGPHPSYGWWRKPYRPGVDGRLGRDVIVNALTEARRHAFR